MNKVIQFRSNKLKINKRYNKLAKVIDFRTSNVGLVLLNLNREILLHQNNPAMPRIS